MRPLAALSRQLRRRVVPVLGYGPTLALACIPVMGAAAAYAALIVTQLGEGGGGVTSAALLRNTALFATVALLLSLLLLLFARRSDFGILRSLGLVHRSFSSPDPLARLDSRDVATLWRAVESLPQECGKCSLAVGAGTSVLAAAGVAWLGSSPAQVVGAAAAYLAATTLYSVYTELAFEYLLDRPRLMVRKLAISRRIELAAAPSISLSARTRQLVALAGAQAAAILAMHAGATPLHVAVSIGISAAVPLPLLLSWRLRRINLERIAAGVAGYLRSRDGAEIAVSVADRDTVSFASQLEAAAKEVLQVQRSLEERVSHRTMELQVALERMKVQDQRRRMFLSVATHELRTPLTAIYGFVKLLRAGRLGELTPPQRQAIETVASNTQRLVSYVNNLLDAARIESGHVSLEIGAVRVRDEAERLAAELRPIFEARGVRLVLSIPEDAVVLADAASFGQIFVNLIANGVKHTAAHTDVSWVARRAEGVWEFAIRDGGKGFTAKGLENVFLPFEAGAAPEGAGVRGTGLGLMIARSLVEAMSGSIEAGNHPGGGALITVRLPAADDVEAEVASPESLAA